MSPRWNAALSSLQCGGVLTISLLALRASIDHRTDAAGFLAVFAGALLAAALHNRFLP